MLRKIGCSLLCAGALFSAKTLAMNYMYATSPGVSIEYRLAPNEPVVFANSWFWTITAICTTHIEGSHTELYAEMINKKAKINGKLFEKGARESMVIHHGEKITISADSGAKVKLINQGSYLVKAHCST
ncbi:MULTISPECIES: hypothetical protein [Legionella]|uniref:Uncharacterized protein n=1 Tax=Legionella donaldsonii TaxID=45060 RepID=A0A378J243_9GAMM|nr:MULTISPECIES: hypothetical protein [Legionella]MCC5015446.1 hypothetical protein [Legionella sp. 31fI33]STX41814.1 Uncharacterised protein [Legionella donaldsonii]